MQRAQSKSDRSADYGRINAAIKTQLAAGGLKGALLKKAVDAKLENWRTTGQVTHRLYDALVFRKVRYGEADMGLCIAFV